MAYPDQHNILFQVYTGLKDGVEKSNGRQKVCFRIYCKNIDRIVFSIMQLYEYFVCYRRRKDKKTKELELIQKAKQPQQNFVFKTIFDIIGNYEGILQGSNLLFCFGFSAHLKNQFIVNNATNRAFSR